MSKRSIIATKASAAVGPSGSAALNANSEKGTRAKAAPASKQARVLTMLRSSSGTTIAAVMKVAGWQRHSVRGFFAGVVRKKLRLKLNSEKIDGNRIYRIVETGSARPKSGQPSPRRKA
jgi:hypothetical protein